MHQMLALVIRRAARVNSAVADGRLEGRRVPLVQGIRRLHVVMAVHEKMRPLARAIGCGGGDDGMKICGVLARLEADAAAMFYHPIGGGSHILGVMALCRNARQPQVLAQLCFKAAAVGTEVVENRLHARGG